jgi:hypothetical protein
MRLRSFMASVGRGLSAAGVAWIESHPAAKSVPVNHAFADFFSISGETLRFRDEPAASGGVFNAMIRPLCVIVALFTGGFAAWAQADTPALLHAAVVKWTAGKEDLAFTQRARTMNDDGTVKEERLERYDPSLPDDERWHLLEVNGQAPTEDQRNAIERRRNRKPRKHANKPPEQILDFSTAAVATETPADVTYEVALRPDAARLAQTEKLLLLITVGRENHVIERVTATLREPMRVALGLARITDVDFDLTFDGRDEHAVPPKPNDELNGTAKVSLQKFGEKMEYEWRDFKRVNAYHRPD